MFSWLGKMIGRQAADQVLKKELPRLLDEQLPDIVVNCMRRMFRDDPDQPLTEIGFRWALALSLTDLWPDLDRLTAVEWLTDYLDVPYGTQGHSWTARWADALAREYAMEFGEH